MTSQPARLPTPRDNGVYATPLHEAEWRADVERDSGLWRVLDCGEFDKATFLRAIARCLEFPAGFGDNWDALTDSLQDLSWLPPGRLVIQVRGAPGFPDCTDGATALDILQEAAMYWATRDRVFIVFVNGAKLPALA